MLKCYLPLCTASILLQTQRLSSAAWSSLPVFLPTWLFPCHFVPFPATSLMRPLSFADVRVFVREVGGGRQQERKVD